MTDALNQIHLADMLASAASKVGTKIDHLSALDAAIGDGDHGTTMERAMTAIGVAINNPDSTSIGSLLSNTGWGIMSIDGGCTGPLLGSFFVGMSTGAGDLELLAMPDVATVFEAGLENLQVQSNAKIGDKTMMDALIPAVAVLRAAADEGKSIQQAFSESAEASEKGAAATEDLVAKFGRARNLGERTLGCRDPGATSISLMFRGFADAVA